MRRILGLILERKWQIKRGATLLLQQFFLLARFERQFSSLPVLISKEKKKREVNALMDGNNVGNI